MIIAGASRHAKEIIQILNQNNQGFDYLYDNISTQFDTYFRDFSIIRNDLELKKCNNTHFALALGGSKSRKKLFEKFIRFKKLPFSVISKTSVIGVSDVNLGRALNIMHFAFIADNTHIGDGSLINAYSSIHHDVFIGEFVELSPRATVLGGAKVGNESMIGAGAIILPNIKIGANCVVGAGSVVTQDIPDNCLVVGVPAVIKKELKP